ncbi:MAG TPA: LemA family protein [Candidatus Pacebacteria bacterium]|nr:MAG: LemA family protein [Microgenomates group bacterium GW2011_GWB1_45_17]KKU23609.1 MAG: LemA family protein [Microgenomates group bacterium GW2011_GWC1_46_15]KKU24328.1 MAG: LemA family protein [Microgenomates group bacterium GW2011_GWA1_46_15]HAV14945.1 LemA family protein [Candidatus Paceibacterota bacterium]HCR11304.1 LemA family protein [Candidatus Paceibacterota bacterium]
MNISTVLIIVGAIVLLYIIGVYNALQVLKTQITAAIQEIGNQLKRQTSLIPNLEASVKGYLKHEKGIFEMLTKARQQVAAATKSGSAASAEKAARAIQDMLPKIQIVVESNPQLKANETVASFMDELRDTADKLMYSRRTVIDLTQDYNMKLMTFPSSLVANLFGFKSEKGIETPMSGSHLEVSDDEMKDTKVSL